MALKDRIARLFGWSSPTVPTKPKKGNPLELADNESYMSAYDALQTPTTRRELYKVYDDIDDEEIAAVLDMYAGDANQYNPETKSTIWVTGKDKNTVKVINDLFDRLRIFENAESIIRDIGKYGDQFLKLNIQRLPDHLKVRGPLDGDQFHKYIESWVSVNMEYVTRLETTDGKLIGFNNYPSTKDSENKVDYKPWEMLHYRLYKRRFITSSGQRYLNVYGTSILYPAIRPARRLRIMDDMLMIHRLLRSLDRRIFKIDVGHSHAADEIAIIKQWRTAMKRKKWIDPSSGKMKNAFDPINMIEDIFFPISANSQSQIDILPGQPNVTDIVDIDHFVNKLFGSLRAPKGYFGYDDASGQLVAKNTLSQQDIGFGRSTNSLQQAFLNGLLRLAQIELALRNINPDPTRFQINMVRPSALEELQRIDNLNNKIIGASSLIDLGNSTGVIDPMEWTRMTLKKVMGMSDEEIDDVLMSDEEASQQQDQETESIELDEVDHIIGSIIDSRGACNCELPANSHKQH